MNIHRFCFGADVTDQLGSKHRGASDSDTPGGVLISVQHSNTDEHRAFGNTVECGIKHAAEFGHIVRAAGQSAVQHIEQARK